MGHSWQFLNISPNGKSAVCTGRSFGIHDIWVLNLETSDAERITFDPSEDEYPVWSPDGNAIAYTCTKAGNSCQMLRKEIGSAGNPHLIGIWPRHFHFTSWSPDGKWLAAYDFSLNNGTDCYVLSADSGEFVSVAVSQANETNGQFSPDGKWLAFQSDESGRYEIYVISFPDLGSKRQISINGGTLPKWDPSGKYIYYLNDNFLISQPVETINEFKKGKPINLFLADASNFDLSPDGKKFYVVRQNSKMKNPPLYLITNWFKELEHKTVK
jgi:Tol biopolymer transport system component